MMTSECLNWVKQVIRKEYSTPESRNDQKNESGNTGGETYATALAPPTALVIVRFAADREL